MAKKNKVAKNQTKKKSDNGQKINPFEVNRLSMMFRFIGIEASA